MKNTILFLLLSLLLFQCRQKDNGADAFGNFESRDMLVTTEIPGKLLYLKAEEGQSLQEGDTIALIDTISLHLKQEQLLASIQAIRGKLQDAGPQVSLLQKQIDVLDKEKRRLVALIADEAASQKQLDDLQGRIDVLQQQIQTTEAQNAQANASILSQIKPLRSQIDQVRDQIDRCFIINPMKGTVQYKLAEPGEIVAPPKALYKIADIEDLELRAYISGDQLAQIRIGQEVTVQIDQDKKRNESLPGRISWIADQAEFTPKTIQTKEERVNLVYAFKVRVANPEGKLKLGMPGEVHFKTNPVVE